MVRVLFMPINFGMAIQTGPAAAFKELGCELEIFDYFQYYHNYGNNQRNVRTKLIDVVRNFKPDLIYCQIQHTVIIDAETLASIRSFFPKVKIIQYSIDVRSYIQGPYFNVSKIADMNLICSTGQLQMYKDNGVPNVHFLNVGYDPNLYYPEKEPKDSYDFDVVFLANTNNLENYPGSDERFKTVKALRKEFGDRFGLFGHGWDRESKSLGSIDINRAVTDVYSKSFCNISISHFNQISHYFSDRLLHCMSSGRPTVSWHFPGYESYFVNEQDLVIAHNSEEIVEKVKWLLDNKDKANLIGMNGAAKVYAEHTYLSRITEMLEMIGLK